MKRKLLALVLTLGLSGVATPAEEPKQLAVAQAKKDLVAVTKEYKESLLKLLEFYNGDVTRASEAVEKRRLLFEQGIISKRELEAAERSVLESRTRVEEIQKQLAEADALIAEAEAAIELAKAPPVPRNTYHASNVLIRYTGATLWNISDIATVQKFFNDRFKRSLPITAYGQSPTHDQLGFDHTNCVDVGLHPDSEEGHALMEFLRTRGIPFLAFRSAVQGASTAPHIHIGKPSPRLTVQPAQTF